MSPFTPIDQMPMLTEVENASPYQIVCWHLYLRPTFSNDELIVVKKVAQRYDAMSPDLRARWVARARGEFER